jgi:hypothetical protein
MKLNKVTCEDDPFLLIMILASCLAAFAAIEPVFAHLIIYGHANSVINPTATAHYIASQQQM